jgi:TolB-like protein/Tfp pilus assembly protein PilF
MAETSLVRSGAGFSRIPPHWRLFSAAVSGLLLVSLWLRVNAPPVAQPLKVTARPSSIAVLPFRNTNPDSSDNYLSYGLGAELARMLGRMPGLTLADVSWPPEAAANPVELGERVSVGSVLEGTVRRAGGRLRVTAHLVDVGEGFDLWSETYEAPASDLLQVQGDMVNAIALTLRLPPGDSTRIRRSTSSPAAYDAYLAGTYLLARGDSRDGFETVSRLIRAVRLDSSFALAHAALAEAQMPGFQQDLPPRLTMLTAESAARRAARLDSMLASPHRVLGEIYFGYHRDWRTAEAEFRRALSLAPRSAATLAAYARFLLAMGRADSALAISRRAVVLNPLSAGAQEQLGWLYLHVRELDRGREVLSRAIQLDSLAWRPHFDLGLLELSAANYGQARAHLENAARRAPLRVELHVAWAQLLALAGQSDSATMFMQQFRYPFWNRVPPYLEATMQAALGQRSKAFASLEQAVTERSELVPYLRVDPRLDQLRADPRYGRLVKRLRLP